MKLRKGTEYPKTSLNMLVYGAPGIGKTRFAASASSSLKTLVIDVEDSSLSLSDNEAVFVSDVKKWEELDAVLQELKTTDKLPQVVVLDTATDTMRHAMEYVKREASEGGLGLKDGRQIYGTAGDMVRNTIRLLRGLDCITILICQEALVELEGQGMSMWRPEIPGGSLGKSSELLGYVSVCMRLFPVSIGEGKDSVARPVLATQPTQTFYAKDRTGKLERYHDPEKGLLPIIKRLHGPIEKKEKQS